jgi:hypothetical protein
VIDIIRRHNRLNGVKFSVAEFMLIAILAGAFATYYVAHQKQIMAFITLGITSNCLTVVILGVRTLMDRANEGNHIAPIWSRADRARHFKENPKMLRDTLAIMTATLLPFLLALIVILESKGA